MTGEHDPNHTGGAASAERPIVARLPAQPSTDGDRVRIVRVQGFDRADFDPFLMLDELRGEAGRELGGGFPPHPHRGMQTLTYVRDGGIAHQDSRGNRGEVVDGGVQWMSAGRGIVHSEMPLPGRMAFHGFQLWINLPAAEKRSEPRYRDLPRDALGHGSGAGFEAIAIAGTWQLGGHEVTGTLTELDPGAAVLDLGVDGGARVPVVVPRDETLLAYVYEGVLEPGGSAAGPAAGPRELLVTGPGECFTVAAAEAGVRLLLLRGRPLREPVVHYGPFVMNTVDEIHEALRDFREGRLG